MSSSVGTIHLHRASVFRLDPTPAQATWLEQLTGACRFVYNCALEQRRDHWRKARLSFPQQCNELTACRSAFPWLAACPRAPLEQALRDLDGAYKKFFAGLAGYPRPRRKNQHDTCRFPQPVDLGLRRYSRHIGALKLPKIGWIKFRNWHPLGGELRNVTIRRRAGHWFASIQWRAELPEPSASLLPPVGIDRGVKVFAALSTGEQIAPINSFKRIEAKLAKLQRRLARKQKFSANWRKLKAKISRVHIHAANARKDFLHTVSTRIAKSHGVVKVEKLNVRGMTASATGTVEAPGRNVRAKSGLNRAILDQGWSMFRDMLAYKLAERGGQLIEVEAAYTSQTCSACGVIDRDSRRDQATFRCVACGHEANADTNAAININRANAIACKPPKRTLRRVGKRNQLQEVTRVAA